MPDDKNTYKRQATKRQPVWQRKNPLLLFGLLLLIFLAACDAVPSAPAVAKTLSPTACTSTWGVLRSGAKGTTVVTLQHLLNYRGARLATDGSFGPATLAAVKSFQSSHHLTVDGVAGPATWGALTSGVVLEQGDKGTAVKAIQAAVGVTQDGSFGPATLAAVKAFQSKKGITVDGKVGPQTWTVASGGSVSCSSSSSRATLAKQIISSGRVSFLTSHSSGCGGGDGADPRSNINDTAAGLAAKRSSYDCSSSLPSAPGGSTYLSTSMLDGTLALTRSYRFQVTEIAGGQHSSGSSHYRGVTIDVNEINGIHVSSSNSYTKGFMQSCRNLGATQVLGPGDAGHSTHIHCAW